MNTHLFIYCLIDPRTGSPFYVGAAQNPKARYNYHMSYLPDMREETIQGKRFRLVKSILKTGQRPILKIISRVTIRMAGRMECFYYNRFTKQGHTLLQSVYKFYNPSQHIFAQEWIKKMRKKKSNIYTC